MADAVLAHLVSRVAPGVDVVFLDTGLHFPETLRVRDEVAADHAGERPLDPPAADRRPAGRRVRAPAVRPRRPTSAASLRKVEPLERALADYDAWAAGLRRDESPTRANTPVVGFDAGPRQGQGRPDRGRGPQADVDAYIARYNVPVNELLRAGLRLDRLLAVHPADQARRGPARRAAGPMFDKTECGLHAG